MYEDFLIKQKIYFFVLGAPNTIYSLSPQQRVGKSQEVSGMCPLKVFEQKAKNYYMYELWNYCRYFESNGTGNANDAPTQEVID